MRGQRICVFDSLGRRELVRSQNIVRESFLVRDDLHSALRSGEAHKEG